ncbi:hypothetical protein [Pleurocapsa sp. PCC 7319]|uniref:hypothetical protein n=1 Tax=Pleurocapsa sp. PCC 7319 TaxID=118161 RepID=UPI00034D2BD2
MVLPRASASLRNPDVRLPILRKDKSSYYLEMQVDADPEDDRELAVTRRVALNELSQAEWSELEAQYNDLDLSVCNDIGINKALEKISDCRIQRLFLALLTFLNPRQVSIILYLYREAAGQGNGPLISFRSNDLLESLGYSKTKDGGFTARVRSQLNQDLVALHRTELVFARSLQKGEQVGAKVTVKSILRIRDYEIDKVPRNFDLAKAADYTYELADAYTVALEFFEGSSRPDHDVLFSSTIDIKERSGGNAKRDYKSKLLIYLASRMKWDRLRDGQYLLISKNCLLKNLDLLGSNKSRNNKILWRTIEQLNQDDYIHEAQELAGKRNRTKIQFQINPQKIKCINID